MNKIDKLISIIRNLKEEGEGGGSPTNSVGNDGLTSKGTNLAGYEKPLGIKPNLMRRLPPGYRKFFAKKRKLNKSKTNK